MSFWDINILRYKVIFLTFFSPLGWFPAVGEIDFRTYFPAAVHTVYGNSFPGRSVPHSRIHRCPDKKNSLTTAPPCGKGVFMHGDGKEKTFPRPDLTGFRSSFSRFTKTCTPFPTPRTPAGQVAWTRTTPDGIKKKSSHGLQHFFGTEAAGPTVSRARQTQVR